MAQTILFELNNKIYNYPYVIVNSNDNNFWGNSTIIRGDFISLFEFLELEKRTYSLTGKVNGVNATFSITPDTLTENLDIWQVRISANGNSITARSKLEIISTSFNSHYCNTCIAYNLATKEWGARIGGQSFTPQNDGMVTPCKWSYSENLYGQGIFLNNVRNLKSNILYRAVYFDEKSDSNYFTSQFPVDASTFTKFFNGLNIKIPTYPNQNPDGDDDNSGQTPSDPPIPGDGDTSSDPIPNPPAKPTFDVTNTGFVVVYNPSVTEIRQLAYFMWSGDFTDLIKKMFASPFEAIISLKMLFCPITAGSSQTVWLGNVETDVSMAKITDQFTDVDLGTINVNEFFGSFADYAPFTKIQIYLPFIGFKDLNVDEVMNSQLHLRYRVDVYTGACIAYLTVTKTIKSTNLNSILYQFDGNCAMEIPFTSNDNSRYVAAIMNSVASSALSLANTSGYTMPVAGKGFNQKAIPSTFELGSLAPVANGMLDIMSAKPNVQRAGSLSGAVSAMALKQPYLIIHRPIAQMPADYQKYLGIPLNLTRQLANVTGYTIVSQVFMSSELATDREIAMITEALKNGVIL